MRASNTLTRILVIALLLLIVSSALAWDHIYRRASAGTGGFPETARHMVIENGGRITAAPSPRPATRPAPVIHPRRNPIPVPSPTPKPTPRRAVVKKGDSLIRLARRMLGNGERWKEIAKLNGIEKPWVIHPGKSLLIPPR